MLPFEIWSYHVCFYLSRSSLLQLTRVNKAIGSAATRALYENVHLYEEEQNALLLRTLKQRRGSELGALIRALYAYFPEKAEDLRQMAQEYMPNLCVLDYAFYQRAKYGYTWHSLCCTLPDPLSKRLTTLACTADEFASLDNQCFTTLERLLLEGDATDLYAMIARVAPNLAKLELTDRQERGPPRDISGNLLVKAPLATVRHLGLEILKFSQDWSDFIHAMFCNLQSLALTTIALDNDDAQQRQLIDLHTTKLEHLRLTTSETWEIGSTGDFFATSGVFDQTRDPSAAANRADGIRRLNWPLRTSFSYEIVPEHILSDAFYTVPLALGDQLVELAVSVKANALFLCWLGMCNCQKCLRDYQAPQPLLKTLCLFTHEMLTTTEFATSGDKVVKISPPRVAARFPQLEHLELYYSGIRIMPMDPGKDDDVLFPRLRTLVLANKVQLASNTVLRDILVRSPAVMNLVLHDVYTYFASRPRTPIFINLGNRCLGRVLAGTQHGFSDSEYVEPQFLMDFRVRTPLMKTRDRVCLYGAEAAQVYYLICRDLQAYTSSKSTFIMDCNPAILCEYFDAERTALFNLDFIQVTK